MSAKWTFFAVITLMATAATRMTEAGLLDRVTAATTPSNAAPDFATPAPAPACGQPTPVCGPSISYNHVCVHRVCCSNCGPPIETVLSVADPSCCSACPIAIPVCLPSCCTGEPTVSTCTGLFGRGVVRYDYCCGLSIKIIFRLNGDIQVTYFGA